MNTTIMQVAEIETLAFDTLVTAGTDEHNAKPLAVAIAAAEADGISSHGLMYLPVYCLHVKCGKVDGKAQPTLQHTAPAAILIDANTGFAHPAINLGFETLPDLAKKNGIAIMNVKNSYNCGVLGYHTERLSKYGLLAMGFTNSPASIAPFGGNKPIVGTNPFSIAVPNRNSDDNFKLLIDQSASVVAKSEIVKRHNAGKEIPPGWVLDKDGNPTTDTGAGLQGSMMPSGGYKGVGMGMTVEIFAALLSGAMLGIDAAPFGGDKGGPPKTGQCFIAIHYPKMNADFISQTDRLLEHLSAQSGAKIPGASRLKARAQSKTNGVAVDNAILKKIEEI